MLLEVSALLFGFVLLFWSADRFVDGAAGTALHFRVPPLLIGIVVVGFGTSAPEMLVSAFAALRGSPGVALGNAYGSNIINIALVLGLTALICPVAMHSQVLRKELPILTGVTVLAAWQLWDGQLSRIDAWVLLAVFAAVMGWSVVQGFRQREDTLGLEVERRLAARPPPVPRAFLSLGVGLIVLMLSSQMLVWGAVEVAEALGLNDLIIGLTVVAIGTSLPELASSVAAARKGETDIAIGNVVGSNLFNTLAVVGIAGTIHPMEVAPELLSRDMLVLGIFTVSLFVIGYRSRSPGEITRPEGSALLAGYVGYTVYLVLSVL